MDPQAADRQAVREPSDLSAERLPRSVGGMVKLGDISRPAQPGAPALVQLGAGEGQPLRIGQGYRLFVRPAVAVEQPLAEPLSVFLIRSLPERIDRHAPRLRVDQLELVSKGELARILEPISSGGKARTDAWVTGVGFKRLPDNKKLTRDRDEHLERFRLTWEHPGNLDAGVEILSQDADEPHRVGRMLVTAQEEAVFQLAIRDFGSPAIWREHSQAPKPDGLPTLDDIRKSDPTPVASLDNLLLWKDQRNPVLDRLGRAREALRGPLAAYLAGGANPVWDEFSTALAEYVAAILAYRRTPIAPNTLEDQQALDLLVSAGRATLMGLKVDDLSNVSHVSPTLTANRNREADLVKVLDDLARIDLSAMMVDDSPGSLDEAKATLKDVDLARRFAAIVSRRRAAADELTADDPDPDPSPPGAMDEQERLPGFRRWQNLLGVYRSNLAPPANPRRLAGHLRPRIPRRPPDHRPRSR